MPSNLHHPSSIILENRKVLVTAGPTFEPIDPVRYIGNRSSGKQGYAIAKALHDAGADVTLISGPTALLDPTGIKTIRVETALEMLEATEQNLPCDIAICTAAVSDWRPVQAQTQKIKKQNDKQDENAAPTIELTENPDILKTISNHKHRPSLVIGFAAETENLIKNAQAKLKRKGCDLILANLVAQSIQKTFGEDQNHVYLITQSQTQDWQMLSKDAVAQKLVKEINERLNQH